MGHNTYIEDVSTNKYIRDTDALDVGDIGLGGSFTRTVDPAIIFGGIIYSQYFENNIDGYDIDPGWTINSLYESFYKILKYFHSWLWADLEDSIPSRPVAVILDSVFLLMKNYPWEVALPGGIPLQCWLMIKRYLVQIRNLWIYLFPLPIECLINML